MKYFLIKKYIIKNLFFLLIILIIIHFFNLFHNIFIIYKRNYEERMTLAYGNCEKTSYGFLKKAYEFTKSPNLNVINFEEHLWPSINNLFVKIDRDVDTKFIVLLNFTNYKDGSFVNFSNQKFFLKKENVILKEGNCYLIKND
jgi:hypothetical protein